MTKKEAKTRKAAWQQALADGRVVRSNDGMTLTSYATAERAQAAVAENAAQGLVAEIVKI